MNRKSFFVIADGDNTAVALKPLVKGEKVTAGKRQIVIKENIPENFKFAIADIKKGEKVIKYGWQIGIAIKDISGGSIVHSHNLKSALGGQTEYDININCQTKGNAFSDKTFDAYVRQDGGIGVRNDIFIIPTVGCVNDICQKIADTAAAQTGCKDIFAYKHPYGCSQLGGDHLNTQLILKGLALHPNAGGVLVVSLGCENNTLSEFKKVLGSFDKQRIRFLTAQKSKDEIAEGVNSVKELVKICKKDKRQPVNISKLTIGLKCGGSDALSGITANPLVGAVSDKIVAMGGSVIMTEVPEMFGAEQILMARSIDSGIYKKIIDM
ncbi:MAG: UxaA family hydrolase, partial [Clostridia bacterium]|nr:UxaA family hydrolase [Clostridia bacterium]